MCPKVKVRGVHATAVTRLLLDEGHEVVEPSEVLCGRFGELNTGEEEPSDVRVRSSEDGLGIYVLGEPDSVGTVTEALGIGEDSFVFEATPVGAVKDAVVEDTVGSGAFVGFEDGNRRGFLPYSRVKDRIEEGDELKVTVKEEKQPWSDGSPVVAGGKRTESEDGLVTLVSGGSGARVVGGDERDARQLTRSVKTLGVEPPSGCGVVYSSETVEAGMAEVAEAMKDASERIDEGYKNKARWIYLGRDGRSEYDGVRAGVTTTVKGHHRLKATSEGASAGTDIAESVIGDEVTAGCDREPIGDSVPLGAVFRRFGPEEGDRLRIVHGKPDGNFPVLGRGEVVSRDTDEFVVERTISSSGTYDGLGTDREEGDTARTRFREGREYYPTVYESKNGDKKGTYVNVCTPVEVFPESLRYIDLYVDVIEVEGETEVIDKDELSEEVERGVLREETAERALGVAESVEKEL